MKSMNSYIDEPEKRPIKGFPKYEVDEQGVVWNALRGNVLKPSTNYAGYCAVTLSGKRHYIHRLVAQTFIPNPEGKAFVNHKDRNPNNNAVENLEWVTRKENHAQMVMADTFVGYPEKPDYIRNGYNGKRNVFIRDKNLEKWEASTKSIWVNEALEGKVIQIQPNEPEMVYDPKLGRMINPNS